MHIARSIMGHFFASSPSAQRSPDKHFLEGDSDMLARQVHIRMEILQRPGYETE